MLDWKILAASFIALIVVSGILVSNFGSSNPLGGAGSTLSDWLGTPPFGNPLEGAKPAATQLVLRLRSPVQFEPAAPANVTAAVNLTNFHGTMAFDPARRTVQLREQALAIDLPWSPFRAAGVKIGTLQLANASFEVSGNVSTASGSLDLRNFLGEAATEDGALVLRGNVSKLAVVIDGLTWDVK